jgi:hypothetical protein
MWALILQIGGWAWGYDHIPEISTVTKPPEEPMEEDHGRGQSPHRAAASVKMKKVYVRNIFWHFIYTKIYSL